MKFGQIYFQECLNISVVFKNPTTQLTNIISGIRPDFLTSEEHGCNRRYIIVYGKYFKPITLILSKIQKSFIVFKIVVAFILYQGLVIATILVYDICFDFITKTELKKEIDLNTGHSLMRKRLHNTDFFSDVPERTFFRKIPHSSRKSKAQFFTPYYIGQMMADWVVADGKNITVLDAGCGMGLLSRAILAKSRQAQVLGYELDKAFYKKAKELFSGKKNVKILNDDFMKTSWEINYDGIISNPPFKEITGAYRRSIIKTIEKNTQIRISGRVNSYFLFLIRIISQLKPDGRAAVLLPADFLSANFCVLVRDMLIKERMLKCVVFIDSKNRIFKNSDVMPCVLFIDTSRSHKTVEFIKVNSAEEFQKLKVKSSRITGKKSFAKMVSYDELSKSKNWEKFFSKEVPKHKTGFVPLSSYGKTKRGIATGANEFFILSKNKAKELGIPKQCLQICLSRHVPVKDSILTKKYLDKLDGDVPKFIFNAEKAIKHPAVKNYLRRGVRKGFDKRFLSQVKKYWYRLEKYPPAPILFSNFYRSEPRTILNKADGLCLTTWICFYPAIGCENKTEKIFAYFQTREGKQQLMANAREVGRGLHRLEPSDIGSTLVPKF